MYDKSPSSVSTHPMLPSSSAASLLPTPYRPYREPKEYGIPFHGQRIFHRAQFIREIDFSILANVLSLHHFEILARSNKIGFRSLDLRTVRLPFSAYLLSILKNSKALRRLCLGPIHIPIEALLYLGPCFSSLTELRLVDCPDSMGDTELSSILRHCSQLRTLEIRGESFTDESLSWISRICLDLEILVIEAPKMTDTVMEQIATSCSPLEHLTLGGSSITDDALAGLTETPLTRLQSLRLIGCREISDETMVALIFNCDQMKKLTIFGSNFTLRTFSSISLHLKELEELHMEHVPLVMNESIQDILLKCLKLRVLKLWHCRSLTQDLFTDQHVPCENLEELEYMDKLSRVYSDDGCKSQVKLMESLITRFERLKVLRLAKLAESIVPVNLVAYLCQLDRLEKFTILENPGIDYKDLQDLQARLRSLKHIGLGTSTFLLPDEVVSFTQSNCRPGIQIYTRILDSSEELEKNLI
ncbi:hypothetical protein BGX27_006533 [Mortierella sp. AM989]|nr:hypothetical protein BGX27_006533 [Mortierella sp. AM989]